MYVVTGEKSYLLTDYSPSRRYYVVRLFDGNGKEWFQLAYRWLGLSFYLQSLRQTDYGTYGDPMEFESAEKARRHLECERSWLDREQKSRMVWVEEIPCEASDE